MMNLSLIQKYNVPGPRYIGYPIISHWDPTSFNTDKRKNSVVNSFAEIQKGLSLYMGKTRSVKDWRKPKLQRVPCP